VFNELIKFILPHLIQIPKIRITRYTHALNLA